MTLPFLDLSLSIAELRPAIDAAIARVLDRGHVLLGPELEAFEREWAAWLGAQHAVGVANGLDALRLSLLACGIGQGDEVIVPSNTYIASWLAVSQIGAIPVPVEPDEATFTIDPQRIADACTARTRAIMPVHLYGHPADLDPIMAIARERGLKVIEDAAQCHGARYQGRLIGSHGDAVAWSFYPTKNLGALADAGAVTTNDPAIADRLRVLRNYGQRQRYVCEEQGWNSRLSEMQAAVLRVKLGRLAQSNEHRARIAGIYLSQLASCGVRLPVTAPHAGHAWHLFVIRHAGRDALQERLRAAGVGTIIHYPIPPHLQAAYSGLGLTAGSLPIAERMHRDVLSLPCHAHLEDAQARDIAALVIQAATGT